MRKVKMNARKGDRAKRPRAPSSRSRPGAWVPRALQDTRAPDQPPGGGPTCRAAQRGPAAASPPGHLEGTQLAAPWLLPAPTATASRSSARRGRQPGSAHLQPPEHVTASPPPGRSLLGNPERDGLTREAASCGSLRPVAQPPLRGHLRHSSGRPPSC